MKVREASLAKSTEHLHSVLLNRQSHCGRPATMLSKEPLTAGPKEESRLNGGRATHMIDSSKGAALHLSKQTVGTSKPGAQSQMRHSTYGGAACPRAAHQPGDLEALRLCARPGGLQGHARMH